jgi:hypothetical protein
MRIAVQIMIIAMSDAPKLEPPVVDAQLHPRLHAVFFRPGSWRAYTARVASISPIRSPNSLTRADDRFELRWAAGLEILQHRRLVRAHFSAPVYALVDRDGHLDPQLSGDSRSLGHDLAHDLRRIGVANSSSVPPVRCTDRIECDVAGQLHPDLMAEPRSDRAAEASRDQVSTSPWPGPTCCRRARRS